ncbi:platelet-derived growth factor receptor beta-like isoform X2 [Periophthalmus magnuspinnatus]|uniref:platelet-derived growth factor receptor beta-like isoform X2 n=1 Tax=Periophthalmus magnuspinnatus TaxID=409849 RepID=UPI00243716A1|nr:platelet-derived growth factor receptor beta-like isoform X2 [Periophthalmus magnuspinnatus]XP_055082597.1 platelet-derived growth factor receptor beta-like isoform X2 [Periophthalmus magnuspinnatus]
MATASTGSVMLHFLFGLFLLSPEGGVSSLELLPPASRVTLQQNANFSTVCSGWSDVTWALPRDSVEGVSVEDSGSSSVLRLFNVTWRESGRYTCSEPDSDQSRTLDLFVPGTGPSDWFLPSSNPVVMRQTRMALVPCSVSDPDLEVELWERSGPDRIPVSPIRFDPALGFTAEVNDTSYMCSARRGQQEALSQVFYVFSTVGPEEVLVDLSSSAVVLRSGDPLMVNCTVSESEFVYFSWQYPRQRHPDAQEVEPLTEFMLNQVRSFLNISETSLQDSGVYVCSVEEAVHRQKIQKSLNITILDRGFLDLSPSEATVVQTLLHHTVALSLHVRAFPPPNITWTIAAATNFTLISMATWDPNITTATTSASPSASTTKLSHTRFLSVLRLDEVQLNQTGSYIATVSNDEDIKEVAFWLEVRAPPRIRTLSEVGEASVLCVSEAAPPPKITWLTCPSELRCIDDGWTNVSAGASVKDKATEKQGLTQVHSVLTLRSLDSVSAVRCESKNSVGRRAWDIRLVSSSLLSQVKVLAAVLVLVVLAVIFLILLIVLWRKKPRWALGWRLLDSITPDAPEAPVSYCDSELPYEPQWEVPRDRVQLGSVLSSGTFGRIVEATVLSLSGPESSSRATVLTPKGGALHSLLSDLKILIHVGPHLNLLNLKGACTRDGPLMVISEWCCHGDLSSYLKKHRHTCGSGPAHSHSESDGYMDMTSEPQYVAMKQLCVPQEPEYHLLHNTPNTTEPQGALSPDDLSVSDLLFFCFQAASAMDFLSQRNVVHRDLGARNVLVSDGKVLKICDFGLGQNLKERQEYEKRGNARLPVKWMSPESIFLCVYTTQSDVWSYGVLLWEIYSMGDLPYPDVPVSRFCSDLKNGKRLERPELAPKEIYDLMLSCWEQSPDFRPSFSSLVESVGKLLPAQSHQRYSVLKEQFLSDPAVIQTQGQTEPGPNQTRTEPGLDQDSAAPQVTVHLSGEEPQTIGPAHSDDITDMSEVTMETGGGAALDAEDKDKSDPSEEQDVTSSPQQESCL